MAPKRKKQTTAKPQGKRTRSTTDTVVQPDTRSTTTTDLQALTEQITKTVTESVMTSLRQSGIIPGHSATSAQFVEQNTIAGTEKGCQRNSVNESLNQLGSASPFSREEESAKQNRFVSSRIPLHAKVPMKKKEKIWAGEFIELSTLQEEDVDDLLFNIRTGAVSSKTPRIKRFMSIEQWTDAFNIFASVYRLKYPSEADGLSAYMSLVRQIADRNGSWYYYDTNFRRIKQSMNLQWSDIEQELFIMAMTKSPQPFRAGREVESDKRSFNKTSKSKRNYKSCDKYNKGTHCGGCNFPHICAFCGRTNHPQFKCRSKKQRPPA